MYEFDMEYGDIIGVDEAGERAAGRASGGGSCKGKKICERV